jgi:uncharacterized membrane protein
VFLALLVEAIFLYPFENLLGSGKLAAVVVAFAAFVVVAVIAEHVAVAAAAVAVDAGVAVVAVELPVDALSESVFEEDLHFDCEAVALMEETVVVVAVDAANQMT